MNAPHTADTSPWSCVQFQPPLHTWEMGWGTRTSCSKFWKFLLQFCPKGSVYNFTRMGNRATGTGTAHNHIDSSIAPVAYLLWFLLNWGPFMTTLSGSKCAKIKSCSCPLGRCVYTDRVSPQPSHHSVLMDWPNYDTDREWSNRQYRAVVVPPHPSVIQVNHSVPRSVCARYRRRAHGVCPTVCVKSNALNLRKFPFCVLVQSSIVDNGARVFQIHASKLALERRTGICIDVTHLTLHLSSSFKLPTRVQDNIDTSSIDTPLLSVTMLCSPFHCSSSPASQWYTDTLWRLPPTPDRCRCCRWSAQ